jgi:hypothetical protein
VLAGAESGAALGAPAMLGLREILQGAAAQVDVLLKNASPPGAGGAPAGAPLGSDAGARARVLELADSPTVPPPAAAAAAAAVDAAAVDAADAADAAAVDEWSDGEQYGEGGGSASEPHRGRPRLCSPRWPR